MVQREVTARLGKDGEAAVVIVNYAENIDEAVEMFGEEAVLSNAFASWRVTLQSNIRSALKKGESPEAIQARLASAKMGVTTAGVRVDPQTAFLAKFKTATPQEQAEMLEMLQEAAQE